MSNASHLIANCTALVVLTFAVGVRIAHSAIQCTYNKVMHRFAVFTLGFATVVALWLGFFITLPKGAG